MKAGRGSAGAERKVRLLIIGAGPFGLAMVAARTSGKLIGQAIVDRNDGKSCR
jgi:cation diffusion facilitator CzcD-associated flavoprotein CzcO